jgi:hypothetical protein
MCVELNNVVMNEQRSKLLKIKHLSDFPATSIVLLVNPAPPFGIFLRSFV